MQIEVNMNGSALVAAVAGRVDTISAPELEKGLAGILDQAEKRLILDFSGVEYISSAGLRVILGTAKTLKAKGGEVRLAACVGSVKKVFQVSGFFSIFKHFETVKDALEDE